MSPRLSLAARDMRSPPGKVFIVTGSGSWGKGVTVAEAIGNARLNGFSPEYALHLGHPDTVVTEDATFRYPIKEKAPVHVATFKVPK